MEYILGLVCFVFGYVTHKFFSSMLEIGKSGIFVRAVGLDALYLLSSSAENFATIKSLRRKVLIESETDKKVAEDIEKLYDDAFAAWKRSAIQNYIHSYPKYMKSHLKFTDWDGAMLHLIKERKKH